MEGALEYFLIRTLPSTKQRLRRLYGNPATEATKKKVAGIRLQLVEREASLFRDVFEGTMEYSTRLQSHLKAVVQIRDSDRKINGIYAFTSLQGSLKNSKHYCLRLSNKASLCFTNFASVSNHSLRSAFAYKNLLGICTDKHLLLYDVHRLDQGAVCGLRTKFSAVCQYKTENWLMMQDQKTGTDTGLCCLDTKKVLTMIKNCTEIPKDAFASNLQLSDLFTSTIIIRKPAATESSGIVVDHHNCYFAYRSELLIFDKRSTEFLRRTKYPKSNLDGVGGRGTKVLYVSTLDEVTAFDTPHMRLVSSVDTFDKKERKILSVKLVRGIELVFAVGQNTGGVSLFCLLGRKMTRVVRCDRMCTEPIAPQPSQYFPHYFVEDGGTALYLFGYHKPVKFGLSWT